MIIVILNDKDKTQIKFEGGWKMEESLFKVKIYNKWGSYSFAKSRINKIIETRNPQEELLR